MIEKYKMIIKGDDERTSVKLVGHADIKRVMLDLAHILMKIGEKFNIKMEDLIKELEEEEDEDE